MGDATSGGLRPTTGRVGEEKSATDRVPPYDGCDDVADGRSAELQTAGEGERDAADGTTSRAPRVESSANERFTEPLFVLLLQKKYHYIVKYAVIIC